jgi:hypothetical protein
MSIFRSSTISLAVFFALASIGVFAQDVTLPEGTALSLTFANDTSSKDAKKGDVVSFSLDKDVIVDGQVLIKQGTEATGRVIYAEKRGYMGHSGKLAIQVESTTTVDGRQLPLRAAKGREGASAGGTTIAVTWLTGPFGALVKGGDTVFKRGTLVTVYTAEERKFRVEGENLIAVPSEKTALTTKDMATVYIYREKKLFGAAMRPSVFCDGIELARMDNGRYFVLKLAPGKHAVHMTSEEKGYEINMGPGQTYYFRIGIEVGVWKGNGKILLTDNEQAVAEIKKLKPLSSSKIKDKSMVVTTH